MPFLHDLQKLEYEKGETVVQWSGFAQSADLPHSTVQSGLSMTGDDGSWLAP